MPLSIMPLLLHNLSEANISEAREEFAGLLNPENVVSNINERLARSDTPWSPAPPSQIAALIVFPASTAEVSAIMKICSRRQIPVTSYCGGTSFHGALTAIRGGVCIDFKHMHQIIAIHPDDMDAVVQPAVGWEELNAALTPNSLFFPPDPGPGARIGGMVSSIDSNNPSIPGILIDRADRHELFWHQCIPTWYYESLGHICDFSAGRWFHHQNTASTP
jgi:D-lactate dehydrogenase (cytochrome)